MSDYLLEQDERLAEEFKKDDVMEALVKQCRINSGHFRTLPATERIGLGHYLQRRDAHERIEGIRKREKVAA